MKTLITLFSLLVIFAPGFSVASEYQCLSKSKQPQPAVLTYNDGANVHWKSGEFLGKTSPGRFTEISRSESKGIIGQRLYRLLSTRNDFGEYMYLSIPQTIINNAKQITVTLFEECRSEFCDDTGIRATFNCDLRR